MTERAPTGWYNMRWRASDASLQAAPGSRSQRAGRDHRPNVKAEGGKRFGRLCRTNYLIRHGRRRASRVGGRRGASSRAWSRTTWHPEASRSNFDDAAIRLTSRRRKELPPVLRCQGPGRSASPTTRPACRASRAWEHAHHTGRGWLDCERSSDVMTIASHLRFCSRP